MLVYVCVVCACLRTGAVIPTDDLDPDIYVPVVNFSECTCGMHVCMWEEWYLQTTLARAVLCVHVRGVILTDDLGAGGVVLVVIVDAVDVELSREDGALGDLLEARVRLVGQPHVELGQPVLQRVDGHDGQHRATLRVPQEHVDERDQLQRQTWLNQPRWEKNNEISCNGKIMMSDAMAEPLRSAVMVKIMTPDVMPKMAWSTMLAKIMRSVAAVKRMNLSQGMAYGLCGGLYVWKHHRQENKFCSLYI